jgi:hypothetical protein
MKTTAPLKDWYVMLHIGTGPSRNDETVSVPLVVTGTDRFMLNDHIWIQRLDEDLAKHIQMACEPPHYKIDSVQQDRHLYAFLRDVPNDEKTRHEGMEELFGLVALSRLVHPTSTGDRYCARIFYLGQSDSPIQAIQYRGVSPDVLLSAKHRDWLSVEDGEELRNLMPWLSKGKPMHDRIHRAYWNHEYAMRSYYLDMRWGLVVSGLEALINAGKDDNAWQFRSRVRQLSEEFKIVLSDDDLSRAYKLRSKLVHAESFLHGLDTILPKSQHSELYEKLESLLRMTLRRCLLEQTFGDFFRDDKSVETRWPLGHKPRP